MTSWVASLPAPDSAPCWAAIDELAHQMHGDDPAAPWNSAAPTPWST
ncbi:MAG: hypothetical protein ABIP19_09545 [Dermatophilaceae bacterium]